LKGVLISGISDQNGPGAKAGLVPGDVITKFNGVAVTRSSELQRLVGNSVVGSTITLDVLRDSKTIQLSAILQELPDSAAKPAGAEETPDEAPAVGPTTGTASVIPGLRTSNLSAALAKQLDIKVTKGVVITNVEANSAADDAGLQRGDVIEQVGQTKIATVAEFETRVKSVLAPQTGASKKVAVYINRAGERNFAFVTIE